MTQNNSQHISVTVSGTKYDYLIVPNTYGEVDIVDHSPGAVSGTPAYSEYGLYLDIAQEDFGGGFGAWRFVDPTRYAYSGHEIDTRFRRITLMTKWQDLRAWQATVNGRHARKVFNHRQFTFIIESRDSTGFIHALNTYSPVEIVNLNTAFYTDAISNGDYILLGTSGRMRIADAVYPVSTTTNTVTCEKIQNATAEDPPLEWTNDLWAGGTLVIFDGTGQGTTYSITSNDANTCTISGTWSTTPDTTSRIFVIQPNAGVTGNPPNDFGQLYIFGGKIWGAQRSQPFLHWWIQADATDAEGNENTDTEAIQIGAGIRGIKKILQFQNQLWVFREDGAWVVGEDNLAYHTLDFSNETHATNFDVCLVHNGFLVFNIKGTLYRYRTGLQEITPPIWHEEYPYKTYRRFFDATVKGEHLYVLARTGDTAGNTTDEPLEFPEHAVGLVYNGAVWHKLWDLNQNSNTVSAAGIWLDTVQNRIVCYLRAGQERLAYLEYNDFDELPARVFTTSTYRNLYTSFQDLNMRRIPKHWKEVTIFGDFPTGTSVRVQYRPNKSTSWLTLGTATGDEQVLAFPVNVTSPKLQFRLQLHTTNSANTPVVRAITAKVMARPNVLFGVTCDIIIADNLSAPNRRVMPQRIAEQLTGLRTARSSVAPITFTDVLGQARSAYLSSYRLALQEYEDGQVEMLARATFVMTDPPTDNFDQT